MVKDGAIRVLYQSTTSTYQHPIHFPVTAGHLCIAFQCCVDTWVNTLRTETTGVVVVDNAYKVVYEGHCLRDAHWVYTCGSIVFQRTPATSDGLSCGEAHCLL